MVLSIMIRSCQGISAVANAKKEETIFRFFSVVFNVFSLNLVNKPERYILLSIYENRSLRKVKLPARVVAGKRLCLH